MQSELHVIYKRRRFFNVRTFSNCGLELWNQKDFSRFGFHSRIMDTEGISGYLSSVYKVKENRNPICNYMLLLCETRNLKEMKYLVEISKKKS